MQESYSVTQDLSYWEYVGLSLYLLPKSRLLRRLLIYMLCLGILGVVVSMLGGGGKDDVSVTSGLLQMFIPFIMIIIFFIVLALLFGLVIMMFRRDVLKGVTFNFTHWGLERIATKSTSSVPWKDFQDAKETKNFFLLFVKEKNRNNIYAIKKASLPSPDFEDELIKFIDKNRPL